jgi:hypothetical protein
MVNRSCTPDRLAQKLLRILSRLSQTPLLLHEAADQRAISATISASRRGIEETMAYVRPNGEVGYSPASTSKCG